MSGRNAGTSDTRATNARQRSAPTRRQFLGFLGAGAAGSIGISGARAVQADHVVTMGSNYFDPVGLSIEPGATVRFEIESGSHSATAYQDRIPAEAAPFDSGTMSDGAFEYTFETPGTYDYYCRPHQSMGMVGRIVVGEPGGPAESSPIPDGDVPDSDVILDEGTVGTSEFEDSGGGHDRMTGSGGGGHGGMMDSGAGMMNGEGPGWMLLMPVGFLTLLLGTVGGAVYFAARRGNSTETSESPIAALEKQYAAGEIDAEEFERRLDRLRETDE